MRLATFAFLAALAPAACTGDDNGMLSPTTTASPTPEVISTATAEPTGTAAPTPTGTVVPMPEPDTFAPTGPVIEPRSGMTATLIMDGRVLLAGGKPVWPDETYDHAELFDPTTGQFEFAGEMTQPRTHHSATLLPDGRVLLAGGGRNNGTGITSAEIYDPATGSFTPTDDMQFGR